MDWGMRACTRHVYAKLGASPLGIRIQIPKSNTPYVSRNANEMTVMITVCEAIERVIKGLDKHSVGIAGGELGG